MYMGKDKTYKSRSTIDNEPKEETEEMFGGSELSIDDLVESEDYAVAVKAVVKITCKVSGLSDTLSIINAEVPINRVEELLTKAVASNRFKTRLIGVVGEQLGEQKQQELI